MNVSLWQCGHCGATGEGAVVHDCPKTPARSFKFGDVVENGWASEGNPTRRGFVVRIGNRRGRMNAGPYVELTDGKGKFWECPITNDHKLVKVGRCLIEI